MEYQRKAVTESIKATSRVTLKIKDNFYAVEFTEERSIPEGVGVDVNKERQILFDDVNAIVDDQCEQILKTFKK